MLKWLESDVNQNEMANYIFQLRFIILWNQIISH